MLEATRWSPLLVIAFCSIQRLQAASPNIVISQVYGSGGNSGATLRNDFIELFNRGTTTLNVTGWTVQYASASGPSWVSTQLSGSIAPGHYYLVQEQQGSGGTQSLPTPEAIGSINMSATSGKVALVNNSGLLSGSCLASSDVVVLVGYGRADCSEVSPAPTLSNTIAILRAGGGCVDTDSNTSNFPSSSPNPRNSLAGTNPCGGPGPTNPTGTGLATPSTIAAGSSLLLTVAVTPGSNPTSTGITVVGNLLPIGPSSQPFFDNGTSGDVTAGENVFSFRATVPPITSAGTIALSITISDSQGRFSLAGITLTVIDAIGPTTGQLIFPHIADRGGYRTVLLFTNSTGTTTSATITFTSSSGSPLSLTIGGATARDVHGAGQPFRSPSPVFAYLREDSRIRSPHALPLVLRAHVHADAAGAFIAARVLVRVEGPVHGFSLEGLAT